MIKTANETTVSELTLHIVNTYSLYQRRAQPIMLNLARKMRAGKYDAALALKSWEALAREGAASYVAEYCTQGESWAAMFTVADRKACAVRLADHYAEELTNIAKEA